MSRVLVILVHSDYNLRFLDSKNNPDETVKFSFLILFAENMQQWRSCDRLLQEFTEIKGQRVNFVSWYKKLKVK